MACVVTTREERDAMTCVGTNLEFVCRTDISVMGRRRKYTRNLGWRQMLPRHLTNHAALGAVRYQAARSHTVLLILHRSKLLTQALMVLVHA